MTMNEKKYKRLEYLRHNIDYLTIRERQEYYELLNELKKEGNYSESEEFEEYTEPEYSDYESENFQQRDLESPSNNYNTNRRNTRESSPSPEKNRNKISTGNKGSKR